MLQYYYKGYLKYKSFLLYFLKYYLSISLKVNEWQVLLPKFLTGCVKPIFIKMLELADRWKW